MKSILIVAFTLCLNQLSVSAQQNYTDSEGNLHLWGHINLNHLEDQAFSEWYTDNYNDQTTSLKLSDVPELTDLSVKIFLGTWCGDTQYLMPRFIKLWTDLGISTDQLELIALHHEGELYKQAPDDIATRYNIHRVPTFVFEKDGVELNRIVERTVFDIETDTKLIANGLPYQPRYKAVALINAFMDETHPDSLMTDSMIQRATDKISRELSSAYELNTYGYVLKASGNLEKAEFIFKLNRELFPYDPYIRRSYGKVLVQNGKLEEAKTEYYEALRIKQTDQYIIKQLAEIDELKQENK